MTTPKEALICAKVCIEDEHLTFFQRESLKILEAAIPVAELHKQAMELLPDVLIALDPKHDRYVGRHEIKHQIRDLVNKIWRH